LDLNPESIRVFREDGQLYVEADGERRPVDRVVRAFPRSDPEHYIGLLDPDGHEIGLIEDPAKLPEASREVVSEELYRAYFVPTIQEIVSVEPQGTGTAWQVTTDDGDRAFRVADRDGLDGTHAPDILVTDDQGRRYLIENYWGMDRDSRDAIRDLLPDKVLRARYAGRRGRR
jgi:hypothetical protein